MSIFNSFLDKNFCPTRFLPCPSLTLSFTRTFVQTGSYRVHLQLFSWQGLLSKQALTVSIFNSFLDKDFCPNRFLPCPSSTLFLTRTFVQPGSASHRTPTRCAVTTEAANKTWRKLNNTIFLLFFTFKLFYFDFFYRNRHIMFYLHISKSSKQQ